jgi:endonuclease/exonuclease/phosphatase family metal-dependent hydrolase
MPTLTIATFNCENLFRRFKFNDNLAKDKVDDAVLNGFILNTKLFDTVPQPERILTAKVLRDTKADIIALQEVENLDTLKNFCSEYNLSSKYKYKLLIDGNDPRLIDVAVLSKYPFERIVTHQFLRNTANQELFSRDCLEVEFDIEGKPFFLFINHLKSMFDLANPDTGRKNTAAKRKEQVKGIQTIVEDRLGTTLNTAAFAILGDFNDYPSSDSSLKKLFESEYVKNVIDQLPEAEKWTHFWDNSKLPEEEKYKQLDYIWLSKAVVDANPSLKPVINRQGLSKKAKNPLIKKRYPEIEEGRAGIAASDHCSVSVKFNF